MRAVGLILVALLAATASGRELQNSVQPSIRAGYDAPRGRYPWLSQLRWPKGTPNEEFPQGSFMCAGALVAPNVVLTTAYCAITSGNWPDVRQNSWWTNAKDTRSYNASKTNVLLWHKLWRSSDADNTPENNIALLRLARPMTSPEPVALNEDSPEAGDYLRMAGWGSRWKSDTRLARNMLEAGTRVASKKKCSAIWNSWLAEGQAPGYSPNWDSERFQCANWVGHAHELCWDDYGAAFFYGEPEDDVRDDVLVGLGAFLSCDNRGDWAGSGYVNVAKYTRWIRQGIKILNYQAPFRPTGDYEVLCRNHNEPLCGKL